MPALIALIALIARLLTEAGVEGEDALALSTLLIATCEGAVVMCRAEHSREPLDRVAPLLVAEARARAARAV